MAASDFGLVFTSTTGLELAIADPSALAPNGETARRYAYMFLFRAPLASPGVEEHVLGLARLTVDDLHELEPGPRLSLDRICDGILAGGEFRPRPDSRP
jgi:hypothetical protein